MPTNPYVSVSISGYNASPPPDDGSQVASNIVTWAFHKVKIGDPLRTLAEAINSACVTFGTKTINTDADQNNAMAGSLAFTGSTLTIAAGSVTATRTYHLIDTQGAAASDDLDAITTGSTSDGCILILKAAHTDRTVVVRHNIGANGILTADTANYSLDDDIKTMILQRRGTLWYEIGRSTGLIQSNDSSLILAGQIFG